MQSNEPRIIEIKNAVDELIRRLNQWVANRSVQVMPTAVEVAIRNAATICGQADVPESCRALDLAVSRLAEEFRSYNAREHGKVNPKTGSPGPAFWAACSAMVKARFAATAPLEEKLEPVSVLLAQGVSHEQIAQHIYGRRGVGPFIQENGTANVGLIEQEAKTPGSVITPGWVPPWQSAKNEAQQKKLAEQLKLFERLESGRRYDDPATVEELLQQGAFVQQIEQAKGVSRAEVLEAAKRIGVKPIDGPTYHPQLSAEEAELLNVDAGDYASGLAGGLTGGPVDDSGSLDKEELRKMIVDIYVRDDGAKGAAEIASEMRINGHDVNTNMVSATIGHYRRRLKEQAGNGGSGSGGSGSVGREAAEAGASSAVQSA